MCGRFALTIPLDVLEEFFHLSMDSHFSHLPRYNIAPSQLIPAFTANRVLTSFRWGLIPSWSKTPTPRMQPINARSETLNKSPLFRPLFAKKRCLIPANGFYEWQHTDAGKQPVYFSLKSGQPFAFAGLWDRYADQNGEFVSCAIITTKPNETIAQVHDRMPVILPKDDHARWLNEEDPKSLMALLQPYPDDQMQSYRVSRFVNSPKNDSPKCLTPA